MDIENKIKEICSVQETVMSCLKSEIDCGVMNVDTDEAGKVVDIVKDLAQTEKYLREAKYYELVSKAMEEKGEEYPEKGRYGYNPRVTGNFHMGYKPMVDQEPYINGYLHDPEFRDNMQYGVRGLNDRQGYNEYGMPYTEYMTARRHYTQTKSMNDKSQMDMHAKEHLEQTIETIEDIWSDASPELKMKMKTDLKSLIETLM